MTGAIAAWLWALVIGWVQIGRTAHQLRQEFATAEQTWLASQKEG